MHDEIYVDGVLGAVFKRGMLRIDLFTLAPETRTGAPADEETKQFLQRLVMTPQGFAEAYGVFTQIMQRLSQSGVVPAGAAQQEASAQEMPDPSQKEDPLSPNF
ncbi:MAG: hypothetical protein FD177_365 [Desulfovibrionaceae bacterium]|nr:MAG: hypothetical protein FD177_365 [Desulfovibrionaceae bacterium]